MGLQAIIDRWAEHSVASGSTQEQREQAIRGYRKYYEVHDLEWPGDERVFFFDSPIAAVMACAREKFLLDEKNRGLKPTDKRVQSVAREIWLSHLGGRMWPTWPAYIEYVKGQMGDKMPDKFNAIIDQAQCGWWWPTDEGVWACDNPIDMKVDEAGNLHCEDDPAVTYADGWKIYMVGGVQVPGKFINDHSLITTQDVRGTANLEEKRVLMELYGVGRFLVDTGAAVVDMDQVPTVLGQGDLPWIQRSLMEDEDGNRWLMTGDGSTEDVYCIPVTRNAATCVEAYEMLRAHPPGGRKIETVMEC